MGEVLDLQGFAAFG